ncbi:MAG TPA: SOS response-associated peptidase [Casimicrobiaceae bacterium]|nr:SOS response-associated peptidase [Casimicrobiaceae bacterium]
MCGRFELHTHPAAIALAFGLSAPPALRPRYNIAPMQPVPIVRQNSAGERVLSEMRWGLVPRWAKDPSIGAKLINARGEGIADKPAFRAAFQWHRCLLPADGFYEWKAVKGGKQPYLVASKSGAPLGLAGLYERWLAPDGQVLDTCTIVTTDANDLLRDVHDRMPLIIAPEDYARWLDRSTSAVTDLIAPYPADALRVHPISSRVNAVKNDDAALLERVDEAPAEEGPESVPDDSEMPEQPELF